MRSFMKILSCSFAAALVMASVQANAADMSKNDTSPQDILSKIHTTNQNEITMAKMALQKAQSAQVKSFAQRMITDHTAADKSVMDLANSKHITLSQYPLTPADKAMMEQLQSSSGLEFDRLYMEANRKGHDKALTMLQDSQKQTGDEQIKDLITQLIPKVAHHDHLAKMIHPSQQPAT